MNNIWLWRNQLCQVKAAKRKGSNHLAWWCMARVTGGKHQSSLIIFRDPWTSVKHRILPFSPPNKTQKDFITLIVLGQWAFFPVGGDVIIMSLHLSCLGSVPNDSAACAFKCYGKYHATVCDRSPRCGTWEKKLVIYYHSGCSSW